MFWLARIVLEEYKPLVTKIVVDASKEPTTKKNLSILQIWKNMLILPCLVPMLHFVNSLIKFAQYPTCYIDDFISTIKIWMGDLFDSM